MSAVTVTDQDLALLLYQAMNEPIGLLVRCSDVKRGRARLYAVRAAQADPALAQLQFRVSPFSEGDLVICKGAPVASAKVNGL